MQTSEVKESHYPTTPTFKSLEYEYSLDSKKHDDNNLGTNFRDLRTYVRHKVL